MKHIFQIIGVRVKLMWKETAIKNVTLTPIISETFPKPPTILLAYYE